MFNLYKKGNKKMKLVFEYHDKEKKQIRRRAVVDDKGCYVGPYEEYYENGQLKVKATYANPQQINIEPSQITDDNGRFVGDYISYFENGKLEEKKHFDDNGQLHGYMEKHWHHRSYGGDGMTTGWRSEYATYNHGKLDGDYEYYLEREVSYEKYYKEKDRDSLYSKCTYKNDLRHGKYEGYLPVVSKEYSDMSYNPHGYWTRCTYDNGVLNGEYQSFELNGLMREQCTLVHGKIHGYYMAFNGGTHGHYKYGVPVGEHFSGRSYSHPYYKRNYNENGLLDGEQIDYSPYTAGEICERTYYKDGKKNGLSQIFRNGRLVAEGEYKDEKYEGVWTIYDDEGKVEKMKKYENGSLVADLTEDALKRQVQEEKDKRTREENRFEQEAARFVSKHKMNVSIEREHQNEG